MPTREAAWQYSLGSSNGFVERALTVAELSAAEIAEAERAAAAEAKAAAVSSCRPRRRQAHAAKNPFMYIFVYYMHIR